MTYEAFTDGLMGIFAYDTGATDSGIRDEALRARLKAFLQTDEAGSFLNRCALDHFLSTEAQAQGYGLADVREFIEWLDERMDCDV